METASGDAKRTVVGGEASGSCSEAFEGGQAAVSEHTKKEAVPQAQSKQQSRNTSKRGRAIGPDVLEMETASGDARRTVVGGEASGSCSEAFEWGSSSSLGTLQKKSRATGPDQAAVSEH